MGFFNRFRRGSATGAIPQPNATRLNGNAIALNANLRTYVNAYTNARNKNNNASIPPLNAKVVNALKRYINSKRPKAAGAAAAAVNNAGGSNANAAAAAAGAASATGSSPNNVAAAAAKPLLALEAPPAQVAAAAAGAAKQQALALGMGSTKANNVAANAAANAATAARPNATPTQAGNAAAAGAAAAGLSANNQAQAAANAAAAAEPNIPGGAGGVNLNPLRGAINQNVNAMNAARARNEKQRLEFILKRVGTINNAKIRERINKYRSLLNAKINPTAPRQGN